MKIQYVDHRFRKDTLAVVQVANMILDEYAEQGYDLTLRQLYYQFVARDLIPNSQKSYNRLGDIVANGRDAGLIDWNQIVDRTRNLRSLTHWTSPEEIIQACADNFIIDKWANQPIRVEVWIEKDALIGVIERVCQQNDVPYYACRGYNSQSEQWRAAQRSLRHWNTGYGQATLILHLGDHDPSGIDMTRDLQARFHKYGASTTEVRRIALNRDQVEEYDPPPNPAKMTDSRAGDYITEHGPVSWELDALSPAVIGALIQDQIDIHKDHSQWEEDIAHENDRRRELQNVASSWDEAVIAAYRSEEDE